MITTKRKIIIKTKTILFDMDGVITNTMPEHYKAWRTVLLKRKIKVTRLDIYRREGQRGISSVKEIFAEYNHPFDLTDAKRILQEKEEFFKATTRKRFINGTRSFIKDLKKSGFILAIVTGTARHELHQILPQSLYDLFAAVITGDDVVYGKPSPEPYLLALKKLKISNHDAVVIENAPFGIAAAKAANLRCFAIATSLSKEYLQKADKIFSSIEELRKRIAFIHP